MKVVLLLWLMSFAFVPLMAQTQSSEPEKRLALVIGNGSYPAPSALPTAQNDATDMAATLKDLGFEVMLYTDLDRRSMRRAVDEFGNRLKGCQAGLFFYSGRGIALADQNYLMPIDAKPQTAGDVEFDCFPISQVLAKMASAQATTNIVLLATDRIGFDNAGPIQRSGSDNGLASQTSVGSIISYATSPGQSVVAGTGRNSIYTEALLKNLKSPGLPIEGVLRQVRLDVQKQTNNRQQPWETSSLTQEFYFLRHN